MDKGIVVNGVLIAWNPCCGKASPGTGTPSRCGHHQMAPSNALASRHPGDQVRDSASTELELRPDRSFQGLRTPVHDASHDSESHHRGYDYEHDDDDVLEHRLTALVSQEGSCGPERCLEHVTPSGLMSWHCKRGLPPGLSQSDGCRNEDVASSASHSTCFSHCRIFTLAACRPPERCPNALYQKPADCQYGLTASLQRSRDPAG
jgi:hypothetical protein